MSLTRNNFHQSTRVASESDPLTGRAPMTCSETRGATPTRLRLVPPTTESSLFEIGPQQHEQYQEFSHQHHDGPGKDPRFHQTHHSSNAIVPSASTRTGQLYSAGEYSRNFFHQQEERNRQMPFQHREDIYPHKAHTNQNMEGQNDPFHRQKEQCYHIYPQNHFRYNSQGEPAHWRPFRTTPSPTNHSVVTNVDTSSHQGSSNESVVDHTYRDFSGVPPSKEDLERYKNKKSEFIKSKKVAKDRATSDSSQNSKSAALVDDKRPSSKKRGRGNKAGKNGNDSFVGFMGTNFPARLHDLLSHENGISDTITWLPHGRSWIVRDKKKFLESVAPSHFQITKFESFTRQVNGWGFKRITQGPDINSYYHELFLKGMPHLIQWMKRPPSSGSAGKRKPRADPKDEPNFYEIGSMYPIPDYYGENGGMPFYVSARASPEVYRSDEPYPPHAADNKYRDEPISHPHEKRTATYIDHPYHVPQYQHGSWDYPVEGRTDFYHPAPKRFRSDLSNHHQGTSHHNMSASDSWNNAPYMTSQYPDEQHCQNLDRVHMDANHPKSGTKETQQRAKEHTSPSKNHWQSFCEALSYPEDDENQQVSNYLDQSEAPFGHVVESIDFEPHSLHDFTPVEDFRLDHRSERYQKECNSRHHAHCYDREGNATPLKMPKIEED